jgi:hypothetical protein
VAPLENPRYPCYVGRGHRLAQARNAQIHRAYVANEQLTFTSVVPYIAMLDHAALNDTLQAALYKTNRELVPYNKWAFRSSQNDGNYDSVEIVATEFDKTAVYYIDYQSLDRTMLDKLPFDDVRQMLAVGDAEGQNQYVEYRDYRIVTELVGDVATPDLEALVAANTNSALDGAISAITTNAAAPGVTFSAGNEYTALYDADYELIVRNVGSPGPNDVTFEVRINPTSGGNDQHAQVPMHDSLVYEPSVTETFLVPIAPFTYTLRPTIQTISIYNNTLAVPMVDVSPGPPVVLNDYSVNPSTGVVTFHALNTGHSVTATYSYIPAVSQVASFTVTVPTTNFNLSGPNGGDYGYDDGILLDLGAVGLFTADDVYQWHGYGPGRIEFASATHNTNQFSEVSTPGYQGNIDPALPIPYASSGTLAISAVTNYDDEFNRNYRFRVYDAGAAPSGRGPDGNRQFTIIWSSYGELPYTQGSLQVDETDPDTYEQVELEKGIYLDIDLGAGHYNQIGAGQVITAADATNLVTSLALAANIKTQWNTHDGPANRGALPIAILPGGVQHRSGSVSHAITLTASDVPTLVAFCQEVQTVYAAHLADTVMHTPIDTIWRLDDIVVSDLATAITFLNDFKAKANRHIKSYNYIEGDEWTMTAKAARRDFTAKDNRNYTLTVGTVVAGTSLAASWYTDTYEGGFDSWSVSRNGDTTGYWTSKTIVAFTAAETLSPDTYVSNVRVYNVTSTTWLTRVVTPPLVGEFNVDTVTGALTFNVAEPGITVGNLQIFYQYLANDVGYVSMPDQVALAVRNFPAVPLPTTERFATGDKFTFSAVDQGLIDWNLQIKTNETISNDDIYQDVLGRVTGMPLTYYIILSETPDVVTHVLDETTGDMLSFTQVMTSDGEPTNYVSFTTKPTNDVIVFYVHKGAEPAPGQYYYVTANRLRMDTEYEVPILYLTRDDMEAGLAPKTTDNHLWIAGDIAFDTAFFGAYFCQVKDIAGNQVFSTADFRRAIDATEKVSAITDLVVLEFFPAVPYAKLSIEKMADPFKRSERMLWVGAPIGTPVGDVNTPNSLVYLAKKTLQFSGDNPARGHVVLLGNPRVTRTVVLDDGSTARVELSGSMLAAYTAARNAEFTNPADTILRKETASFDDMDVFNEAEQDILGSASITWLNAMGSGAFRFEESTTVDVSAPDLNEISAMNQKIYVTRKVARDMDNALISVVPPSPAAGVALVQAYLADELGSIASSNVIAPYGSETDPPTLRTVNSGDMYVFVDELDRRVYHIGYFFNIRYPIKKILGLYSVDTRFWDARQ